MSQFFDEVKKENYMGMANELLNCFKFDRELMNSMILQFYNEHKDLVIPLCLNLFNSYDHAGKAILSDHFPIGLYRTTTILIQGHFKLKSKKYDTCLFLKESSGNLSQ